MFYPASSPAMAMNPSVSTVSLTSARSSSTQQLMNKKVSAQESLYHMCLCVKKRLECLPQLQPYLNLAYSSAEILTEHQALLLSQKQQQQNAHQDAGPPGSNGRLSVSYTHLDVYKRQVLDKTACQTGAAVCAIAHKDRSITCSRRCE